MYLLLALLLYVNRNPAKCVSAFQASSAATSGSTWLPGLPRAPGCLQSQPPRGRSCPTRGLDVDVRAWSQGLLLKRGFPSRLGMRTEDRRQNQPRAGARPPGSACGKPQPPFVDPTARTTLCEIPLVHPSGSQNG